MSPMHGDPQRDLPSFKGGDLTPPVSACVVWEGGEGGIVSVVNKQAFRMREIHFCPMVHEAEKCPNVQL